MTHPRTFFIAIGAAIMVASTMQPSLWLQSLLRNVAVDGLEGGFGEIVLFEASAELTQRRGIREQFAGEIDADEGMDRLVCYRALVQPLRL